MDYRILAINPGSTSTKIALYHNRECEREASFSYSVEQLAPFPTIMSQKEWRLQELLRYLTQQGIELSSLSAVVGRGGAIGPVKSGAYQVNELLVDRLTNRPVGQHASNLGGVMAYEIACRANIPAYVYDGVTVDELDEAARITGLKGIRRYSRCHALNMRACAISVAEEMGRAYADCNFVVAHMGGGTTMSAHQHGRMCDILIDSEGAFSAERAGRLPATALLKYLILTQTTPQEMLRKTRGQGGMVSLLGTNSVLEVEQRALGGDAAAAVVLEAMCYQVAKGIGELSAALSGEVDRIILTGAVARSAYITDKIERRVRFIAPVVRKPGERELEALAFGALRVLQGQEKAHEYDLQTDRVDADIV